MVMVFSLRQTDRLVVYALLLQAVPCAYLSYSALLLPFKLLFLHFCPLLSLDIYFTHTHFT